MVLLQENAYYIENILNGVVYSEELSYPPEKPIKANMESEKQKLSFSKVYWNL